MRQMHGYAVLLWVLDCTILTNYLIVDLVGPQTCKIRNPQQAFLFKKRVGKIHGVFVAIQLKRYFVVKSNHVPKVWSKKIKNNSKHHLVWLWPLPVCQWPPGLWNISSRGFRKKKKLHLPLWLGGGHTQYIQYMHHFVGTVHPLLMAEIQWCTSWDV